MKKRYFYKLLSFLIISVLLCSCSPAGDSYIAKVNDEQLTIAEYKYYFEVVKFSIATTAGVSPSDSDFWANTDINGKNVIDMAKETALDDAVKATVIAQQAKKEGLSAEGADVTAQINAAKKSEAATYLKQQGVTDEGLTHALKKAYLKTKLFEKYVAENKISVTDENIAKFYNENYRRVKHILFLTSDPSTGAVVRSGEQAYALASDVISKINQGNDFDELAKNLSEDTGLASYPNGYTITDNGQMVAEFETAAFELEIGQISPPVKTSYGYHVLKREALLPIEQFKLSTDYSSMTEQLKTELQEELIEQWRSQAKIEKNESKYNEITIG